MKDNTIKKPHVNKDTHSDKDKTKSLVLHNDDHHTFEYVIDALIKVCKHNPEQATQCTYIVHYKGKCDVKNGGNEHLSPMRVALVDKGLKATIE